MNDRREIELKLEFDPDALVDVAAQLSALFGQAAGTKRLRSTYFDTAKLGLKRRGLSLRLRHDGDRQVQTLKAARGGGLFDRSEWEAEIPGALPDLAAFDEAEPRDMLARRGTLLPLFEVDVMRTTWLVREGSSQVEVALDTGTVFGGGTQVPLAEIELELKDGAAGDLFAVAGRLRDVPGLRLGVRSKSERGYALLNGAGHQPVKAEPLSMEADFTAAEAFRVIARSCLRQFRLNEQLLLKTRDAGALHQARVALRRLRSAFSIFKRVISDGHAEELKSELRAVAGLLGDGRNLDVYGARVLQPELDRDTAPSGVVDYANWITGEREAAYDAVTAKLESREFRLFVIRLAEWIECGDWLNQDDNAATREVGARSFARSELKRRRRKVRRSGRGLDEIDPDARHQVRIAAKKLRYASEFFADLFVRKTQQRRHRAFVSALETLQDRLGALNDIQTGRHLAEDLARRHGRAANHAGEAAATYAAGLSAGRVDESEPDLLRAAAAAHDHFAAAKAFWR